LDGASLCFAAVVRRGSHNEASIAVHLEVAFADWQWYNTMCACAGYAVEHQLLTGVGMGYIQPAVANYSSVDLQLHKIIRAHGPLYSSSIRPNQQDSLLYTQFSRTHPSSISSSIHSIHYGTHLSLYLNISMCDLVLKDLLRRI
jgi:hypothetical protein